MDVPPWLTFQQLSVRELNLIIVSILPKVVQKSGAEQQNERSRFPSSQTKVSATRWSLQPLLLGKKGKQHWFIWASLLQSYQIKWTSALICFWLFVFFFCLPLSLYFYSAWNQWVLILSRALWQYCWYFNNIIEELLTLESFRSDLKARFSPQSHCLASQLGLISHNIP